MTSYCSECGAELIEGSKFCTACGKNVVQPEAPPVEPEPERPAEQPEQPVEKKQPSPPPKPKKKPKKKLLIGILALIIVAIVVVVGAVYFLNGTPASHVVNSPFIGEWGEIGTSSTWTFNNSGAFGINPPSATILNGTWGVTNNQLHLYSNLVSYTFEFSNNNNTLNLTKVDQNNNLPTSIFLSKGELQGTSETPTIHCSSNSTSNKIIIDSVDAHVRWSDIGISANNNASWQVQDIHGKGLARIGVTSTITVYVSAGDSILLLDTTGEVTATLTFKPTNQIIGSWSVNV